MWNELARGMQAGLLKALGAGPRGVLAGSLATTLLRAQSTHLL